MILHGKTEVLNINLSQYTLHPQEISFELARDWTRPSGMKGWQQTVWAMAQPKVFRELH